MEGRPVAGRIALAASLGVHLHKLTPLLANVDLQVARDAWVTIEYVLELSWMHFIDFLLNADRILPVASASTVLDSHLVVCIVVTQNLLCWGC